MLPHLKCLFVCLFELKGGFGEWSMHEAIWLMQPMEEWVVFLIMGSVLPGHMSRYQNDYDYDYDYIMAPQRGRPYGANLGSMGRNTGTWSIRSECLSNITSWSRRKGIENTTLPFIPE